VGAPLVFDVGLPMGEVVLGRQMQELVLEPEFDTYGT